MRGSCVKRENSNFLRKHCLFPDLSDPVGLVLLRHVNFRISADSQSAYPQATWQWLEEFPEKIVAKGGTGRIQLYGVPDFDYADVSFDQKADIRCSLLKIVPMAADTAGLRGKRKPSPSSRSPVDPQVWYEKAGAQRPGRR